MGFHWLDDFGRTAASMRLFHLRSIEASEGNPTIRGSPNFLTVDFISPEQLSTLRGTRPTSYHYRAS